MYNKRYLLSLLALTPQLNAEVIAEPEKNTPHVQQSTKQIDPFWQQIEQMHREFEKMHTRIEGMMQRMENSFFEANPMISLVSPSLTLEEKDDVLVATVKLPTLDPEAVTISIEHHILRITGKIEEETKGQKDQIIHRSHRSFEFVRALPTDVDATATKAEYHHETLTITMPKVEKRTRIKITKK
jgi:HSP20 family molecular chaperone IbpA